MPRAILAMLMIAIVPIGARAQQPRALDVLSIYRDLNEMCRNPDNDDLHRAAACNVREKVERLLNGMGYCFGKADPDQSNRQWHKCSAHELF
jgi:hypothetical protein